MKTNDENYMHRCLDLAVQAKSNGKTAVGSVIVKDNRIIAEGIEGSGELPASLAHAEMIAILNAHKSLNSKDLSDCILYTTVEPCFMCSYLIRQSNIKKVVFGITTPETGGASSEFPFLTSAKIRKWHPPPEVIEGVLKEACRNI